MNRGKSILGILIVILLVVLTCGGSYYLGTKMNNTKSTNEKIVESEDNKEKTETEFEVPEYPDAINNILYNYLKSNSKSFDNFLNDLSNYHKLYLAGIIGYDNDSNLNNKNLDDLKKNLVKYFGSDLNIKGEDFGVGDEIPLFKYDENKEKFVYNEEVPGGCLVIDIDTTEIYNYKLDTITTENGSVILTYYGLYAMPSDIGPTTVTNNKNIERVLNYDQEEDGISDEYYLNEAFKKNKNDFFKFVYTYKLVNGKYVLVDFKQE
ncbi:hypothetical protein EGR52_09735 [bacterium]|nr:hypothetical protein [bacterium]